MYFFFIWIAVLTYIIVFMMRSLGGQIFDQFLRARLTRNINNDNKNWICNNPKDEWISAETDKSSYAERTTEDIKNNDFLCDDSENDSDVEDLEILLADPETFITKARIEKVIKFVWAENASTFGISMRSIGLIVSIKFLLTLGCVNELLIGVFIGMIMHSIDLLIHISGHMKKWYFDNNQIINIDSILNRNNKVSQNTLIIFPTVILATLSFIRANMYTRILGEWVVDLRFTYMYISLIVGYLLIQNIINIISSCRKNPVIAFLSCIYIGMAFIL